LSKTWTDFLELGRHEWECNLLRLRKENRKQQSCAFTSPYSAVRCLDAAFLGFLLPSETIRQTDSLSSKRNDALPDSFAIIRSQMELIGTAVAAERLGVSADRVRALIKAGRLPAKKLGRDWFIDPKDLARVKDRKPGRPRKKTNVR